MSDQEIEDLISNFHITLPNIEVFQSSSQLFKKFIVETPIINLQPIPSPKMIKLPDIRLAPQPTLVHLPFDIATKSHLLQLFEITEVPDRMPQEPSPDIVSHPHPVFHRRVINLEDDNNFKTTVLEKLNNMEKGNIERHEQIIDRFEIIRILDILESEKPEQVIDTVLKNWENQKLSDEPEEFERFFDNLLTAIRESHNFSQRFKKSNRDRLFSAIKKAVTNRFGDSLSEIGSIMIDGFKRLLDNE